MGDCTRGKTRGATEAIPSPTRPERMATETFCPSEADHWRARGRTNDEAETLAAIWRAFPDLSVDQSLEARQARSRQRVLALRPFHDAIDAAREAKRRADNIAFMEAKADDGTISTRGRAILTGRDRHGLDWDDAVAFADGWYAAHAGWVHDPRRWSHARSGRTGRVVVYDLGFVDGGPRCRPVRRCTSRRFGRAAPGQCATPRCCGGQARPLPNQWPKPADAARPVSWSRRLAIVGDAGLLERVLGHADAQAMTVVAIGADGFVAGATADLSRPLTPTRADTMLHQPRHREALRALIAGHDYDDVLVAGDGEALRVVDAVVDVLPLCRTMERTRNSVLQQRAQLRLWLGRGRGVGDSIGGGHIRWGKTLPFLSGRLGEFTARHVGPAPLRGHLVRIEIRAGELAHGYGASDGRLLDDDRRDEQGPSA